jgi:P27 family predicted phage terminase small subunit
MWVERKNAMGRQRLPDSHHALLGTKYRDRHEPSQIAAGRPKQPDHLCDDAKKEWRRIIPLLEQRGTLSKADSAVLAVYCETHARWLQAKREVATHGLMIAVTVLDSSGEQVTTRKPNPALKIAETCERSLRSFLREFGCTPQSRERVKPTKQEEKPKEDEEPSEFAIFHRPQDDDETE